MQKRSPSVVPDAGLLDRRPQTLDNGVTVAPLSIQSIPEGPDSWEHCLMGSIDCPRRPDFMLLVEQPKGLVWAIVHGLPET